MNGKKDSPISMVYVLFSECECSCPFCHGVEKNLKHYNHIDVNKWKDNIAGLLNKRNGSIRLTLSGGEPMKHWESVFEFIQFLHEREIHICLNTTGIHLDKEKLFQLDGLIDQILLSFRATNFKDMEVEFGLNKAKATQLLEYQYGIFENIKRTNINLEVSTVVTKENQDRIKSIGWRLYSLNPNIIWRIEEYYANGIQNDPLVKKFELDKPSNDSLYDELLHDFYGKFYGMKHSSKEGRVNSPDLIIMPDGKLHKSNNHTYEEVGHVRDYDFSQLENRRDWTSYKQGLIERNWERDRY